MDRVTQREEEQYQKGRRDGLKGLPERDTYSPFYLAGWREGTLELMTREVTSVCTPKK